jgi:predicted negative regulator of RcsB-dependent stress response
VEEDEEEWPPPKARVRSAIWRAESHIERGEYAQAARALAQVFGLGGDEALLRGLYHLAAAGRKHQDGQPDRARRQLEHARRRLGRRRPRLVELVERELAS